MWVDFGWTAGHEQSGHRPALVLSPKGYNELSQLCLVCAITTVVKGLPYEVPTIIDDKKAAILADQIQTISWTMRKVRYIEPALPGALEKTMSKLSTLLPLHR